jgi:MarR family transcriptional regulator for hemolysin
MNRSGPPAQEPLGLALARSAKVLNRAFDDALVAAGGSLPVWLVLVSCQGRRHGAQRELAGELGIEGPTLTHHLDRMEAAGLLTRRRDPADRRVQLVELTDAGEALFTRLLTTVAEFDTRLRAGITEKDADGLRTLLAQLVTNITRSADDALTN